MNFRSNKYIILLFSRSTSTNIAFDSGRSNTMVFSLPMTYFQMPCVIDQQGSRLMKFYLSKQRSMLTYAKQIRKSHLSMFSLLFMLQFNSCMKKCYYVPIFGDKQQLKLLLVKHRRLFQFYSYHNNNCYQCYEKL